MSHEARIDNCQKRLAALSYTADGVGFFYLLGAMMSLAHDATIQTNDLVEALERATVEAEEKAKREVES